MSGVRVAPDQAGHLDVEPGLFPAPAVSVDALRRHCEHQAEERETAREQWQETGLVITTRRETPIEPRHLNRHSYMYADMTEKRAALDKRGDLLSDE